MSTFLLLDTFVIDQWLQDEQVGRWRDDLVGERAYLTPSVAATSLLAWQVCATALAP